VPTIKEKIQIPLLAAGGIATGQGMFAAMALGADGVQIGSRFAATIESSAHKNFKDEIVAVEDGDTMLTLKEIGAVRLIKNKFYKEIEELNSKKASKDELQKHLGRARIKKGVFEGDMDNGELEIGQIASVIGKIQPVSEVMEEIVNDFYKAKKIMSEVSF
jgi:enoyl-[acyl-carrier protein] reductase II